MLGTTQSHSAEFHSDQRSVAVGGRIRNDRWRKLAASTILVLGSPRSGTSWLAKIFDSHPDILYRHEPDEAALPGPDLDPIDQVSEWIRQRALRVAVKRPNFPKSWRPAGLASIRLMLAAALATTQRLPLLSAASARIGVPDLVLPNRKGRVRAAIKLVDWDGNETARAMPQTRSIFILRHPCGQVASLLAGHAASQFAQPVDQAAAAMNWVKAADRAARAGIDAAAFRLLPNAAKLAWYWVAFNEPAIETLAELPNAKIVLYEDLCQRPELLSQELLAFAGLSWHPQTAAFLESSTQHNRSSGYFDVFRTSSLIADRWRQTMSEQDQEAVRSVVSTSPLRSYWPDPPSAALSWVGAT